MTSYPNDVADEQEPIDWLNVAVLVAIAVIVLGVTALLTWIGVRSL